MHYGKLEEFVTSVSETVPGLLSYRHQAKLSVGLRARVRFKMSHGVGSHVRNITAQRAETPNYTCVC